MTCPESQSKSVVTGTVSTLFSAMTPVPYTGLDKRGKVGRPGNDSGTNNQQNERMNKLVPRMLHPCASPGFAFIPLPLQEPR